MTFGYIAAGHIAGRRRNHDISTDIRKDSTHSIEVVMKISLFYEFPLPRPWGEDDEHHLFQDGLTEVEAADKRDSPPCGSPSTTSWEEYCTPAPPRCSGRGQPAHQGHPARVRVMHLPPPINHPPVSPSGSRRWITSPTAAWIRHRRGFLGAELGGFTSTRRQAVDVEEALEVSIRCMVEEPVHRVQGPARRDARPNVIRTPCRNRTAGCGWPAPAILGQHGRRKGHRRTEFRLHRAGTVKDRWTPTTRTSRRRARRHPGDQSNILPSARPVDDGGAQRREAIKRLAWRRFFSFGIMHTT